MRNFNRAAAATAAIIATSLAITACGRSEGPASPGGSETAPTVSEGPATGTLTVWAMGAEGEALPQIAEKFKAENPDVTVNITAVPWADAYTKFKAAIAANQAPDVAQVGTTWMGEFAASLDALDPTPASIDKAQFFEGAWGTTEVGGTSYGVPWYVETRLVFYRTDLAQQAGVTEATDWDGLKAMAKAMKDNAGATWGIALQPGQTGSWQTVLPFMWSNGGNVINADGSAWTWDDPKNAEALAYYQSFFTEELADKAPVQGTTEADFASGRVPMFISGPWMMAAVENAGGGEEFKDKYDVMLMPTKESATSFVGGSNLAVFKNTQNRDAAWKFVEFLSQEQTQIEWYKLTTDLPAVQSAWNDPSLTADAKLAKFGEQLQSAVAPPSVATWEQVSASLDAQVEQVTRAGADPTTALATVQSEATSIGLGG
jgi:multiple sugar transport system substrate-binding protein